MPLGSCTPLALCQPTAANVVLLLDQKLKSLNRIIVHPLENTASMVLSAKGLETFIRWGAVAAGGRGEPQPPRGCRP